MERIVDEIGRIVLPLEYRRFLKIQTGSIVDIERLEIAGEWVMQMKKLPPRCSVCQSAIGEHLIHGKHPICERCLQAARRI